jgi:hypothetical protein
MGLGFVVCCIAVHGDGSEVIDVDCFFLFEIRSLKLRLPRKLLLGIREKKVPRQMEEIR